MDCPSDISEVMIDDRLCWELVVTCNKVLVLRCFDRACLAPCVF